MNEFGYLLQYIYWYSESKHSGAKIADFLIEKKLAGSYAEISIFTLTPKLLFS